MRRCTTCDARLYGGEYGRCSDCINASKVVFTDEQIDRAQDDARLVAEFPLSDQTPNNEE